MKITLDRFAHTPMGTFGQLRMPEFMAYTVERPWKDNRQYESCIPTGTYRLQIGYFYRGGYPAYELLNVPDRLRIKIHIGNTMQDVLGCIALGSELGYINGLWAVTNSRETFKRFMQMARDQVAEEIEIRAQRVSGLPSL